MFLTGADILNRLENVSEPNIQEQPAGVDLTVESIAEIAGDSVGSISKDGKEIADRVPLEPSDSDEYELTEGSYIVVYGETIDIPSDSIGFVYPRSSLMRNGSMLFTAIWDPGYTGKGEGLLRVTHPINIEQGARLGQIALAEVAGQGEYNGTYDGERVSSDEG